MKELITALAVAASVGTAILAAAVYRTWTEDNMMIMTVAVAISVVITAVTIGFLSWRAVDYHFDSKESKQRTEQNAELLREMQVLKASSQAALGAQRVQTETFRTGRLAGLLQAQQIMPPGFNGVVDDPWMLSVGEDDNETTYV